MQQTTITPLEALAQLAAVAGQIDTAECKDEGIYNRLQGAVSVADHVLAREMVALAMAPKQEAPARKPVAYMAFADNGSIRVWAEKDNLGAREAAERMGVALMPVYAAPAAANGAPGYAEKASPIAITDSSALNGIKWYVPPPEHLRNGMQLYFVAPQPVAASGPDAALIEAARNVVTCFNDPHTSLAYVARWVNELSEEIAALSGAKDIVSMCKCKLCKGEGWVCENHADKPWTSDAGGCKCGAGAPCTCNSNADLPDGFTVLSGAKGN